ncbi:MAG: CotH kinase family protein, partial [Muribaculaceae bacterium]|nr:CotH kinase family protein [Muribaculaceae bacterium]
MSHSLFNGHHSVAKAISTVFSLLAALTMSGQTGTLPVIYIDTQNHKPIYYKSIYIPGTYYIIDKQNPDMNVGNKDFPQALEIRGRGHSSWQGKKKPYKIKLAEKTPLLGMNKDKHWALLKFNEPTVAGLQLGNIMGMDWTPSTRPVEVVLNDDYLGLYLLTETNRIGKNRLNIYEQPNWNLDDSTIPYGWLVEVDNYEEASQISVKEHGSLKLRVTYH